MIAFIVFQASVTNAARHRMYPEQGTANLVCLGSGDDYREFLSDVVAGHTRVAGR